jgi:hypothetical protein
MLSDRPPTPLVEGDSADTVLEMEDSEPTGETKGALGGSREGPGISVRICLVEPATEVPDVEWAFETMEARLEGGGKSISLAVRLFRSRYVDQTLCIPATSR